MSEPTNAQRRTAEGIVSFYRGLREGGVADPAETGELADAIAAALAAEREKARAPFERLFAGGPDTSCRTTWRPSLPGPGIHRAPSIECVEVPMDDLRAAFGDEA